MAKKSKRRPKRHNISPDHLGQTPSITPEKVGPEAPRATQTVENLTPFVGAEVRRVIKLAAIFIGVQLILWWVLEHSAVGPTVYGWVKL